MLCGGLLADVVCRHGHTVAAQGRVSGCCVEGFWPTWFVPFAAVGKVSAWCVGGFWLVCGGLLADVVCRHGQGSGCFAVGFWSLLLCGGLLAKMVCRHGQGACFSKKVCGFCVEGFWPTWAVVMGRAFAAVWRVSGCSAVWRALADVVRWHGQGSGC